MFMARDRPRPIFTNSTIIVVDKFYLTIILEMILLTLSDKILILNVLSSLVMDVSEAIFSGQWLSPSMIKISRYSSRGSEYRLDIGLRQQCSGQDGRSPQDIASMIMG